MLLLLLRLLLLLPLTLTLPLLLLLLLVRAGVWRTLCARARTGLCALGGCTGGVWHGSLAHVRARTGVAARGSGVQVPDIRALSNGRQP